MTGVDPATNRRRIHLLRHAEYEGFSHAEPRFVGRTDPPLSHSGRDQAAAFATARPDLALLPVLASPAQRAEQTARLALPGSTIEPTPLALEIDYGALDGLFVSQAARLFPEHFADPAALAALDYRIFGGESMADLADRAQAVVAGLARFPEAVLVSHGIFMAVLLYLLNPRSDAPTAPFALCGCLSLEQMPDGCWTVIA